VQDPNFWSSPDQRAERLFRQRKFAEASKTYRDPYRRGIALYRAGDFKTAAATFATIATPEAAFDRGNSLVMQGKYADAVESYDRALSIRAGWKEAEENRAIAVVRRERMNFQGGDATGGEITSDQVVFGEKQDSRPGEQTEVMEGKRLSDEELRGLWLRRVQTKPADFLRAKFAFQAQSHEGNAP
jgi:Ca-activated chloride channel homolog